MSSRGDNPFGHDPFNPYAAPESMDPSKEVTGEDQLATLSARFAGAFLDGLIVAPVLLGFGFYYGASRAGQGLPPQPQNIQEELVLSGISIAIFIVWYLIVNGYLLATRGQTVGKLAAGTRIVDFRTGELVPLLPLFLKRNLVLQFIALIPMAGRLINLIGILLIFRSSRRCLHDEIAGTKVINVKK